ncbi:hypothetical protein NC652_020119 [Populus alba x Populus x berolinensis]|uniref:Uncharacterized protein n=1 Tax=Populus alba x Populus x berolinensis TaxID=444605 RepID=A0AAD6QBV4_9ROSI|nr:hypothetical protein NC652_020119 [Populus alba x Populus x berolinensis]KAJ6986556.1 hypothetical protein NC653_019926 [Populus alba x Populus x berolinensis]
MGRSGPIIRAGRLWSNNARDKTKQNLPVSFSKPTKRHYFKEQIDWLFSARLKKLGFSSLFDESCYVDMQGNTYCSHKGFGFAFEELIKEDPSENCNFYLDGEAQNLKKLAISVAHMLIGERNTSDSFMGKFKYIYVLNFFYLVRKNV